MGKFHFQGHAAMLGANVMWGLLSPISKFLMVGGLVSPLVVTDMRIGGAMILFWLISFFQKPEHVSHKDMGKLFLASLLGIVFNQGLFIFGVSLSSPGDASIITTSMPLWAMLLAAIILKEPITGKKVLGIAAGACGALLLILGGRNISTNATKDTAIWGDILVLCAEFCYALYIVLFKNFIAKYSLVTIMKWMFTFAFICTIPFSASSIEATQWEAFGWKEIGGLGYCVVFATFAAYLLLGFGQKKLRPTVAGMYNYIQPIVACAISVYLGMDSFNMTKALAIILIFGGVYLVTISKSKKEMDEYEQTKNNDV